MEGDRNDGDDGCVAPSPSLSVVGSWTLVVPFSCILTEPCNPKPVFLTNGYSSKVVNEGDDNFRDVRTPLYSWNTKRPRTVAPQKIRRGRVCRRVIIFGDHDTFAAAYEGGFVIVMPATDDRFETRTGSIRSWFQDVGSKWRCAMGKS